MVLKNRCLSAFRQRFLTLSVYNFFTRISLWNFAAEKFEDMNTNTLKTAALAITAMVALSCEVLDDDIQKHTSDRASVELGEVARILASIPMEDIHLKEVHDAAKSSSLNGYDEEYTMKLLFESPGSGVGDPLRPVSKAASRQYLRDLIEQHLKQPQTKSSQTMHEDPDRFIEALSSSDIQIYWPFCEEWDGETMPIITFDPEDGSDVNIGYRLFCVDDGSRQVEEVVVDERMAGEVPVWVVNRNSDAEYTSLEMLRRDDPAWGEGGGTIIVKPETKLFDAGSGSASSVTAADRPLRTLILKDFTMNRNYDSWFAGASEFFVKIGSLDDFTASTEAELKLFNPLVTDFMIVVKRSQVGKPQPFNAVLISDWNPQMTHCAFMITEDDGGTRTDWKCTALVRIASKSYGVEISLPFNSRDDIVWRGHLTDRWVEANSGKVGHFGDVDLTFELQEY